MMIWKWKYICAVLLLAAPLAAQRRGGGGYGAVGRGYPDYAPAAVERGKATFVANCGFCHGPNAKGGESGPDLIRSELVIDDDSGEQIRAVILNGRADRGMPKFTMTQQQTADIAAFLHQGVKDAALRSTYKILNIVTGDAKAGQAYFNGAGKCNTCHSAAGDLKGIGARYQPVDLQTRFLSPRAGRGGGGPATAITAKVTLPSGEAVEGRMVRIDDFLIALTDARGEYRSYARHGDVPKVELHDPLQFHIDMWTKYTDKNIHDLTAYLVSLK
jgi:mono/diheme cytochrome c family protein